MSGLWGALGCMGGVGGAACGRESDGRQNETENMSKSNNIRGRTTRPRTPLI